MIDARFDIPELIVMIGFVLKIDKAFRASN